jgi:hypothetical protein
MAAERTNGPTADENPATDDPGLPPADDPGGAHAKGYSADPRGKSPDVAEPVPLADAPPGGIIVHERDPDVHPTGRREPPDDPNNRIVSLPE